MPAVFHAYGATVSLMNRIAPAPFNVLLLTEGSLFSKLVLQGRVPMADVFRVPMDVTYAIAGGEPALMAYRRWRNLSRDDLAAKSGISKHAIEAIEDGQKDIEEEML